MILMQALRQLATPYGGPSDLIPVTALGNKQIAIQQKIFFDLILWNLNLLDLIKDKVSPLYIRHTEVWFGQQLSPCELASERYAASHV
ncbi:hypothetical protein D3C78_962380 [compost metagenome]